MTQVVKALFTDLGFEMASLAVQVYGGHGYIREHGVEQYVRDARIAMLYEGTNRIQALDLVGRKMPAHMGRRLRRFFHPVWIGSTLIVRRATSAGWSRLWNAASALCNSPPPRSASEVCAIRKRRVLRRPIFAVCRAISLCASEQMEMGFRITDCHLNGGGICDGGAIATFADVHMALAITFQGGIEAPILPTISLSLDYLSAGRLGEWVQATGEILRQTSNFVFAQTIVRTGDRARERCLQGQRSDERGG